MIDAQRRHLLAALGATVAMPGWAGPAGTSAALRRAQSQVQQRLQALVDDRQRPITGVAVTLLRGGRSLLSAQAGWRRIGQPHPQASLPVEVGTRFRIASVSKLVLALLQMRLHEARILDLDTDLATLVHHPQHPGVPITPRLLLTHRSGLRDRGTVPVNDAASLRAMLRDPAQWDARAPGAFFAYCNAGSIVLATAMEAAAGQRFDALMQRWVLDPLGLRARHDPGALAPAEQAQLATLYRRADDGVGWKVQADGAESIGQRKPPDLAPGENAGYFAPQGGLRISVAELGILARVLMQRGRWQGKAWLSARGFDELLRTHWQLSETTPGETVGGIFRRWALGLQAFTDTRDAEGGDRLHAGGGWTGFGHLGEAYGLFSGLIFSPATRALPAWGLAYAINGTGVPESQSPGRYSSFTGWEEEILSALLEALRGPAACVDCPLKWSFKAWVKRSRP